MQPFKDRRTRRLQTLFGRVEVEAPRIRVCRCRRLTAAMTEVVFSPVCALLTARCTPELGRVQAELGARTSFREAARTLDALLPVSAANHESVRLRTHAALFGSKQPTGKQRRRPWLPRTGTGRSRPR
jgi:hypothetical protein